MHLGLQTFLGEVIYLECKSLLFPTFGISSVIEIAAIAYPTLLA
ncbi:hypothetical protein [Chroococcidiopsis sp. TS-821]|nr:hypothetical protein [Chroococcidiopsis sp. TS-821]